jgi:hypothetical protein
MSLSRLPKCSAAARLAAMATGGLWRRGRPRRGARPRSIGEPAGPALAPTYVREGGGKSAPLPTLQVIPVDRNPL